MNVVNAQRDGYLKQTDELLNHHRYRELVKLCREALATNPDDAELHHRLAIALERVHRLEEARCAAEQALRINPGHLPAQLILAKIDKRAGDLEAARSRLDKLQYTNTPSQFKCEVFHELGSVCDRLGNYTLAFYYFTASNQEMLRTVDQASIRPDDIFEWIDNYRQVFTPRFMHGWDCSEPDDDIPSPIFLVGFPRSGTTLTEQLITAGGGVWPTNEEPLIHQLIKVSPKVLGRAIEYPAGLDKLSEADLTSLRRHYWSLAEQMTGMNSADKSKRLLDKLPLNLIELGFIHRIFPRAPVVLVLRDPRDSCLSCFMNYFVPNEAMINFSSLEQTAKLYAAVMSYWLQLRAFVNQPVMEIHYEDMVQDFEGATRPLFDFLGLEWSESISSYHEQAGNRDVRTPSYVAISQPIFRGAVGRWKNYRAYMERLESTLSSFVEEFGYTW